MEKAHTSLVSKTLDLKQISPDLLDKMDFALNNINYLYSTLITMVDFHFSILKIEDENLSQKLNAYKQAKLENENKKYEHERKYGAYGKRKIEVLEQILDMEKSETSKTKRKKTKKQKQEQRQPTAMMEIIQPEIKPLTVSSDRENTSSNAITQYKKADHLIIQEILETEQFILKQLEQLNEQYRLSKLSLSH